jgi:hypothetical protein
VGNNSPDPRLAGLALGLLLLQLWPAPAAVPDPAALAAEQLTDSPGSLPVPGMWQMDSFSAPIPYGHLWDGGWPANVSEASDRVVCVTLLVL